MIANSAASESDNEIRNEIEGDPEGPSLCRKKIEKIQMKCNEI